MSTLKDALNASRDGYMPIDVPRRMPSFNDAQPSYYPFVRCSFPPITVAAADSIDQFAALANRAPSQRVVVPNISSSSGSTTTINKTFVVSSTLPTSSKSQVSSSASDTDDFTPTQTQVSVTTPTLDPNGVYYTTVLMAKSFILLSVSTNNITARAELYGTQTAQNTDAGRSTTSFPSTSAMDNIISDAVVTTPSYVVNCVNTTGFNGDSPQSSTIYVTVTNLDVVSAPITVTFTFVPLEQ